ncbi:MAG: hypothetical protein AUG06_07860 [Actinobacteria bacterium 13_1_20CM_2_65_11]|nr:MAG: hypothetical protein AUH40_01080 [Chloroflexi bacterium 13_1_40CM_65_17]OLC66625.1 MAG: hypothetical protein AUH69_06490 [Actinobacteria bacterium 13_1_40CM_4_65_12]OLD24255.1 MAG: hypothetical protein AUJ02_08645 [Chloroflexi bacterium 13_1_40CM_3_65_12]OLD50536.1 MAG: hypothetical protein AUI42_02760 [Actinobacteria bacterium 13_1_40CM_2_65_8]OLE79368.1 MAG: hypothetical protein AUG06_07860 [Actinobacteria bacterium 13_1_20CM_2_65_11]
MVSKTPRLLRQLSELDRVLDYLERMNLHDRTDVSMTVTDLLQASGFAETQDREPTVLIPRVLDVCGAS